MAGKKPLVVAAGEISQLRSPDVIQAFICHPRVLDADVKIEDGCNALAIGPLTIPDGVSLLVPVNSTLRIM
jgi:hypothetical protein